MLSMGLGIPPYVPYVEQTSRFTPMPFIQYPVTSQIVNGFRELTVCVTSGTN